MKIFILKSAIIFIFCLLFFRFTFVSVINEYENKLLDTVSSSNFKEIKADFFESLEENNNKDVIFWQFTLFNLHFAFVSNSICAIQPF